MVHVGKSLKEQMLFRSEDKSESLSCRFRSALKCLLFEAENKLKCLSFGIEIGIVRSSYKGEMFLIRMRQYHRNIIPFRCSLFVFPVLYYRLYARCFLLSLFAGFSLEFSDIISSNSIWSFCSSANTAFIISINVVILHLFHLHKQGPRFLSSRQRPGGL